LLVSARGQECPRYTIVGGLAHLVEILVSHLSAKSAERWGTRLLGEGEIEWASLTALLTFR
jgi:hypothetical protein